MTEGPQTCGQWAKTAALRINGGGFKAPLYDAPVALFGAGGQRGEPPLTGGGPVRAARAGCHAGRSDSRRRVQQWCHTPNLTFTLRGTSATDDPSGPTLGPNPGWTHIAAIYDGSRRKIYINANLSLDIPGTGSITSTSELVHFGSGAAGSRRAAVMLDDIGIWNTALTQQPITDLANGVPPVETHSTTFLAWISDPTFVIDPGERGLNDDPDGDGIPNGVENFFGTNPGGFSQGLVAETYDAAAGTFTFTHPQGTLASDLTATYQWSKNLVSFHPEGSIDGTTVTFSASTDASVTTVTATTTGTIPEKLFVRVIVTQNQPD